MARYTVKDEHGHNKTVVVTEPRMTVPDGWKREERPDYMKNYRSKTRYTSIGRIEEEWWVENIEGTWHDIHRIVCDGTVITLEQDGVDISWNSERYSTHG